MLRRILLCRTTSRPKISPSRVLGMTVRMMKYTVCHSDCQKIGSFQSFT